MTQSSRPPVGFLSLVLHAHLPYVVNHGTWPHGMEWLHEAAAETYLPLLRVLRHLERDGVPFPCTLNLSPILLEQLAHPVFVAEFPKYLARKIVAAQEDEAFFEQSGEAHYVDLARYWRRFFTEALDDFNALDGSIVSGFRHFNNTGFISIITCAATHGYLPLLGTDESVRAQVRTAVSTHERHFGTPPRGIWSPECGYRPAGPWTQPVAGALESPDPSTTDRIGLEQAFAESSLDFFIVDTHLVESSHRASSVYQLRGQLASPPADAASGSAISGDGSLGPVGSPSLTPAPTAVDHELYHPYLVDGPSLAAGRPVRVFARDPRTGLQVWSGDSGYPGDGVYLDFHKKRWPGGHRYWRVTGSRVGMDDKQPYRPEEARERVRGHAAHFVHLLWEALSPIASSEQPPVLCAPFDAELFGHWWFEGPLWLEAVARTLHDHDTGIDLIGATDFLDRFPPAVAVALPEGSWGSEGNNDVWLNAETGWTWAHIYPAEHFVREVATAGRWHGSALGTAIVQQLCRELLLLESSDWQFLITTGAARDYAESRFRTHSDQFNAVRALWQTFEAAGALPPEAAARLAEITARDGIFPEIDPSFWAAGAHANPGQV